MDKGTWEIYGRVTGTEFRAAGVMSDDFEHDVILYVNGDFKNKEQKQEYCEWLKDKLNAT